MKSKYDLSFIKKEYNSDLLVSEYTRKSIECGLIESEKRVFEKYIKPSDKIIDIGCGAGRISFGLYSLGYKNVYGCDLAPNMIIAAKNLNKQNGLNLHFFIRDICKRSIFNKKYDVAIFSFNGLMCIPGQKNRKKAVKNINHMLKEGGLFIFTAHDREKIDSMNEFFKQEKDRWDKAEQGENLLDFGDVENPDKFASFLHIPNSDEIKDLLEENGFVELEIIEKDKLSGIDKNNEEIGNCFFYVAKKVR